VVEEEAESMFGDCLGGAGVAGSDRGFSGRGGSVESEAEVSFDGFSGIGTGLTRCSGDTQGITGGGASGVGGDGQGTGVGSPGSGPGAGSDEPPTPLDFGTPITFPAEPGASVCSGAVCPQTLTVAEFGSPSNIFMFARGSDNAIWVREIRNSAWRTSEWKSLGGKFISQPAASSMRDGRVDVLGVWEDLSTRILTFQNGVWETEWTSLGGDSSSPPSSCGLVRNQLNVIHVGPDNALYHKNATDGNTWGPSLAGKWDQLAGSVSSSLDVGCAAVSSNLQRFDIVAYGPAPEHAMFFKRWNTTGGWQDWAGGKGSYKGDPTVVSTPERVDYFGIGADNAVWTTGWTSSTGYSEPLSLGGSFQSAVSGIAIDAKSRLDILAVGNDTRLKHRGRSHGLWGTEWEDLGGSFNSAPKVVLLNSTSVGVFGVGLNGEMIHSTFTLGTGYYWGGEGQWYSDGGSMASSWHRQGPA
jgi:hypothetical protein